MSEPISFREIKLEGGWLMIKPEQEDLGKAMAAVRKNKDKPCTLELKEYRKKRSLDANAYAWTLIDKIAAAVRITKTEIYRNAIKDIGGVSDTVCVKDEAVEKLRAGWSKNGLGWQTDIMQSKIPGCTNVVLYYGSSSYSTHQMSVLIDQLIEDAKALGIETMPQDRLEALLSAWT